MAGYRLCRVRAAEIPFFIESISTNIYTIEELCFFLHNNIPLIDASIMNRELTRWIAQGLGLTKLSVTMEQALARQAEVSDFVMPVFREIGYLTTTELASFAKSLSEFSRLPLHLRLKMKGDALVRGGKYQAAIRSYRRIIEDSGEYNFRPEFLSGVWYNCGVAEMKLMLFEEGLRAFTRAYDLHPTKLHARACMRALAVTKPAGKFSEALEEIRSRHREDGFLSEELREETLEVVGIAERGADTSIPEDLTKCVQSWMREYRNATG